MPDIEISSAQLEALEALQDALADQHVGAYGTVRPRDALQYLLDYHEADGAVAAPAAAAATSVVKVEPSDGTDDEADTAVETAEPAETADAPEAADAAAAPEAADAAAAVEAADATEPGEAAADAEPVDSGDAEPADADADSADPDDRLEAMMNLMSEHDDKWEVSDSDEGGKYVVELPDGKSMHVRTKDDVRGLLFKHYG